jgi:hypothetical protein
MADGGAEGGWRSSDKIKTPGVLVENPIIRSRGSVEEISSARRTFIYSGDYEQPTMGNLFLISIAVRNGLASMSSPIPFPFRWSDDHLCRLPAELTKVERVDSFASMVFFGLVGRTMDICN